MTISALVVASAITGIGLTTMTFSDMHEVIEWLFGGPVWTHEMVHAPTKDIYVSRGYEQFPDMPTQAEAEQDYRAAAAKALACYGQTIRVVRGEDGRQAGPMRTLLDIKPDAEIIGTLPYGLHGRDAPKYDLKAMQYVPDETLMFKANFCWHQSQQGQRFWIDQLGNPTDEGRAALAEMKAQWEKENGE